MTIALGILAVDGVVIAADSQETVQGYWKANQGKIWLGGDYSNLPGKKRSFGVCGIAGAGRAGYADSLTSRLMKAFHRDRESTLLSDVQQFFESETSKFHVEHVAPYSDLPDVAMVIGYERNYHMGLFSTDRGTVIPHTSFTAVGIGAMEAQSMLRHTWTLRPDVATAIVLAAYAVFLAKERVDGCGSFTDILYLRQHVGAFVPREAVERLEQVFRRAMTYLERPLLHRVLGANVPEMPGAGEMAEVLRRDILGVGITLIEGPKNFDPEVPQVRPSSTRGRKVRPPSRG